MIDDISEYINNKFKDNNTNIELINEVILDYIDNNNFNIDDVLDLLENNPKLLKSIELIMNSNITLKNNILVDAYKIINNQEDEEEYNIDITKYFSDKKSLVKDVDIVKLYILEITNYPLLSNDEIIKLFIQYKNAVGDEKDLIRNKIINHNLRLVVSIAKRYQTTASMSLLDLIQEGNIGLYKAVDKYDYEKGYKFSTYATWWIRLLIKRSFDNYSRTIRIPIHMVELVNKYNKTRNNLLMKNYEEPSDSLIAEELHLPLQKVLDIKKYSERTLSLDEKAGTDVEGDDYTIESKIPYYEEEIEKLPDKLFYEELKNDVFNNSILNEREKKVLSLRYGLGDNNPLTLAQVGKIFNLTRERIRQIEEKSIIKIRRYYIKKKKNLDSFDKKLIKLYRGRK